MARMPRRQQIRYGQDTPLPAGDKALCKNSGRYRDNCKVFHQQLPTEPRWKRRDADRRCYKESGAYLWRIFRQVLVDGATEVNRKYYTFEGWYTEPTGGSKYTEIGNTMPATELTVYAHWMRSSSEVIYKDWNGDILKTQEVAIGADATPTGRSDRSGYTFTGWDNPSTNIQDHTTITAKYTANGFILTLNGNGGTLAGDTTKNQVLAYGESIDQVLTDGAAEVSRKYYTFEGWYSAPTGGSKYAESGNTMPDSNIMVYAHWMRSSSEVIYKDWNGNVLKNSRGSHWSRCHATSRSDPERIYLYGLGQSLHQYPGSHNDHS